MLSFTGSLRIFIALDPCDMRAGVNTLHALVGDRLKEDSRSGTLFVFTNRRRKLIKVLYWDGTGMWLMTKRLEQGTFFWPRAAQEGQVKLEANTRSLCDAHRRHRHARREAARLV